MFQLLSLHFFDIDLQIKDNKISAKLYDELDSSPFEIVRISSFNSNIPSKLFYSSNVSEILHLVRNITDHLIFIILINKLLDIISEQRIQKRDIKILLNKNFVRHFEFLSKFAATIKGFHILFNL